MNNENLTKIAKVLDVSEDSIKALPEEIQNAMMSAVNLNDTNTEENAESLYNALNELWTKGMILESLREIAKRTGMDYTALCNLSENAQYSLVFEYAMDSTNFDRFHQIVEKSLAVKELPEVAKLIDLPLVELSAFPIEKQERLCSIYAMEYDENGDNSELTANLRSAVCE